MDIIPQSLLPDGPTCSLIPGLFGVCIQILLAAVALSWLLVKRSLESPQRPVSVFLRDASKQAAGGTVAHFSNLLLAHSLGHRLHAADDCDWYFLNVVVDTTAGVAIEFLLLSLSMWIIGYVSGQYEETGQLSQSSKFSVVVDPSDVSTSASSTLLSPSAAPAAAVFLPYAHQVGVWVVIVLLMKLFTVAILVVFHSPLSSIVSQIFRPLRKHPKDKLVVVMVATPLAMNSMAAVVTDQILKRRNVKSQVETDN